MFLYSLVTVPVNQLLPQPLLEILRILARPAVVEDMVLIHWTRTLCVRNTQYYKNKQ